MTPHLCGLIAAAWMATASGTALAQASAPARPAPSAASASAPIPPAGTAGYQSAFDGYRRFDEQKVMPWRDANDLVGRIGGWRAYAREDAGGDGAPANAASAPSAPAPSSQPAAASSHGGRHTPHRTP